MKTISSDTTGAGPATDMCRISIVVPVYRHWHLVPDLVAAIAANDLAGHRAELVLVDDEPGVPRTVALPDGARIVPGPGRGSYAARNAGVLAARGTLLVFTDADCRPAPGWLDAYSDAAVAFPERILAGPVEVRGGEPPNACEIYEMVRGIPQQRYIAHGYAATANLAVPAGIFADLRGFQDARRSGGDAEFCRRAGRRGYGICFVPRAGVTHVARASWSDLADKARRVKGGQVASGSAWHRLTWTLRTLAPPAREIWYYLVSDHPLRYCLIAGWMRLRLWGIEVAEAAHLINGAPPRR